MSDESSQKQARTRSPAYPAIDLEDAIKKAATLWSKVGRHAVPVDVAGTYWEYDKKSSAAMSAISALKKYALAEEDGSKQTRTIKLTDLAIQLTYQPDVTSKVYQQGLKTAALAPSINRELWEKYGGQLPDDAVIKRHLVVERRFNEVYVDGFIAGFRKTIEFAKLSPDDTIPARAVNEAPEVSRTPPLQVVRPENGVNALRGEVAPVIAMQDASELSLPLESGKSLRVPRMSEDDYELMLETLKLWKRRIVIAQRPRILPGEEE